MYAFSLPAEQRFDAKKHVERVLGTTGEGDVTIACWEPGQTSPYHCHPDATEIYFCFEGGGTMRDDYKRTRKLCRTPARRAARRRQWSAANSALPGALRRRDVGPHKGMAEQP